MARLFSLNSAKNTECNNLTVHEFRISSPARVDIDDIPEYIRQDNPLRAESFIDELYKKILQITERPLSFPTKAEISPATRATLHGKYLILFTLNNDLIDITRVVHGARNLENLF